VSAQFLPADDRSPVPKRTSHWSSGGGTVTWSPRRGSRDGLDVAEVALGRRYCLRVQALVGLNARGGAPSRDDLVRGGVDDEFGCIGQCRDEFPAEV